MGSIAPKTVVETLEEVASKAAFGTMIVAAYVVYRVKLWQQERERKSKSD
jgi:hypothetical protein